MAKLKHYALYVDKRLVGYVWASNKSRNEIRKHLSYDSWLHGVNFKAVEVKDQESKFETPWGDEEERETPFNKY